MNYRSRQTGQVVRLVGCEIDHIRVESDPFFYASRIPRADFDRLFEPICEDEGLLATRKECDGLRIDLEAQKAIVTNLKVERDHLRTVADNRNSHLELIRAALDHAGAPTHLGGEPNMLAAPMTVVDRIKWVADQRDKARIYAEQEKAKHAHEDGFSALQIQKRTEAEDAADQLRVELARAKADLAGLNQRLTPLRMKLTAAALNGLLSNPNTGRDWQGAPIDLAKDVAQAAVGYAHETIAALKEVQP